ncbi:hypothetical protein LX73_2050 [Fodinibius salinus]|uniref:Uncharacterized protein n=1 Tax=Fodinibius salinus TaxID=860790 RepID=A0A5D3YHD0_9BACT|nr:hypothetical protein [Fodinibius salinus]TYP92687.1 hypothetical protein LX73_2050 [Fodinibius salinus]
MDQIRWKKIEGIIDEALDKDTPKEQKKIIDKYSDKNKQLHQELLLFLESIHEAQEENFLQK